VLAAHYGFTDEELDFIPSTKLRAGNYDIKYRTGCDAEEDVILIIHATPGGQIERYGNGRPLAHSAEKSRFREPGTI